MDWHTLVLFFLSTFVISATPGPNMLLAFQYGINHGVRRTIWTLAGLSVGLFMLLLVALLGLDVINRQYPWVLNVIKAVGGVYLAYLGWQSWQHASDGANFSSSSVNTPQRSATAWQLFQKGVLVSLSNPKAILFFAAFFPKFINFAAPLGIQYLLLTIGFFISETFWQIIYTFGGQKLATWLQAGKRLQWLNQTCGVLFICIALAMIWEVVAVVIN